MGGVKLFGDLVGTLFPGLVGTRRFTSPVVLSWISNDNIDSYTRIPEYAVTLLLR